MALPRDESVWEKNGGETEMTDQEIIKALRCCASIASCYKCPFQTEMICRAMLKSAAADRLEELTENRSSVMMPKEVE